MRTYDLFTPTRAAGVLPLFLALTSCATGDKAVDTSIEDELAKCRKVSDLVAEEVAEICYAWSTQSCYEYDYCDRDHDVPDCNTGCRTTLLSECVSDMCAAKDPAQSVLAVQRACPDGRSANVPLDCTTEIVPADECNGVTQSAGWQATTSIEDTCPCVYTYETAYSDTYNVPVCNF